MRRTSQRIAETSMAKPVRGAFSWLTDPGAGTAEYECESNRLVTDHRADNSRITDALGGASAGLRDSVTPSLKVWPLERYNPDTVTTPVWVTKHVDKKHWKDCGAEAFARLANDDKALVNKRISDIISNHIFVAGLACDITCDPPGGGVRQAATCQRNIGASWMRPEEGQSLRTLSQILWISNHSHMLGSQRVHCRTLPNMAQVWITREFGIRYDTEVNDMTKTSRGCIARHCQQRFKDFRCNVLKRGTGKCSHGMIVRFQDPFTGKTKENYRKMTEGVKGTGLMPYRRINKERNECYVGVPRTNNGSPTTDWYLVQ